MIESLNEGLTQGLQWVVIAAWRTLPLLAIVLAIDLFLRRKIPARCHCILWMFVVARMLLPVSIASPISMEGPMDRALESMFCAESQSGVGGSALEFTTYQFQNGQLLTLPILPMDATQEERVRIEAYAASNIYEPELHEVTWHEYVLGEFGIDLGFIISTIVYTIVWIWCIVAVGMIFRNIVAYGRFAFQLHLSPELQEQSIIDEVLRVCDSLGVSRRPKIKHVDSLTAPAVFGFWSPVLCLPTGTILNLSRQDLTWILRHELAHVKRRDAILLSIAMWVHALHWFNPIAWLAVSKLRIHVEQAADDLATRGMSSSSIADYGRLLLRYAGEEGPSNRPMLVGLLTMASGCGLKRRIEMLDRSRPNPWLVRGLVSPALLMIGAAGLTDAMTIELKPIRQDSLPHLSFVVDEPRSNSVIADEKEASRIPLDLDVRAVLAKVKEMQPGIDAERFLLMYLSIPANEFPIRAEIVDGQLYGMVTARQHWSIQRVLSALEQSGPWQINVECRILQTAMSTTRDFSWNTGEGMIVARDSYMPLTAREDPFLEHGNGPLPATLPWQALYVSNPNISLQPTLVTKLAEVERNLFVNRCQGDRRSNLMQAPKVTLINGQAAMFWDISQSPFVTNVKVVKGDQVSALQPVIEVIDEGWEIRFCAEVNEDESVDLSCIITETTIEDVHTADLPIRTADNPAADITVQVPNVKRKSIGSRIRLASHESLLIASPKINRDHEQGNKSLATFYMFTPVLFPETNNLAAFMPKTSKGEPTRSSDSR